MEKRLRAIEARKNSSAFDVKMLEALEVISIKAGLQFDERAALIAIKTRINGQVIPGILKNAKK